MQKHNNKVDFSYLFLNNVPLLDVRAPAEFTRGAFPHSENIPLLDDDQRQQVGLRYKQAGQEAAVELGWQLATPEIQEQRLIAWRDFCGRHPGGYLYCFRGGLRSRLSQQLLAGAGIDYPRVEGGYKAMRRYLIDELDRACKDPSLILVAGPTGSGKTWVIKQLHRAIDLESRANHRGSSFGARLSQQPAQIDFENAISIDWLKLRHQSQRPVFVEDEGRLIGRRALPVALQQAMIESPLVVVEEPFENRVDWVVREYVAETIPAYRARYGELGVSQFDRDVQTNLFRIHKRLGQQLYRELTGIFARAARQFASNGCMELYRTAISLLLRHYYDPMYTYQLSRRRGARLFSGDRVSVADWANHVISNRQAV